MLEVIFDNWKDFSKIFLITLIFIIINAYFVITSLKSYILDNWRHFRHKPWIIPFSGFIINTIRPLTNLAPLLYDFSFLIPLYLLFFMKNEQKEIVLPHELKGIIFLFIIIIFLQTINPFNPLPLMARIIGLKVWLFYLPFIWIGYHCFKNSSDILKFCKIFSLITIIPCL